MLNTELNTKYAIILKQQKLELSEIKAELRESYATGELDFLPLNESIENLRSQVDKKEKENTEQFNALTPDQKEAILRM